MAGSEPLLGGRVTMLAYYLLGVVLGAGSSVVPGPCGLAVIDAATRLGSRRAIATAIGSGLGDLTYAALGVFGIGQVLARDRELVAIMLAASGVVLIGYGLACLRGRPVASEAEARSLGGIVVGFATLVCNPGALLMWSSIGIQIATATRAEHVCAVFGIGSGSAAWFVAMAVLSARCNRVLGERMHRVVQVIGCLIVAYGAVSLARAVL
ncbi:MAG TPA: LysE family transporter [Kofleriaceae bacterium]|nr:LysE family transporter [Kofleriaceae bacterium]